MTSTDDQYRPLVDTIYVTSARVIKLSDHAIAGISRPSDHATADFHYEWTKAGTLVD